MAEAEPVQEVPKMTLEEVAEYRTTLRNELASLELAQSFVWSQYKQDRINRLKGRLGIAIS